MKRFFSGFSLSLVAALGLSAQVANVAGLRVTDEVTPAGAVAQVKLELTEPKPIVRTSLFADFSDFYFDEFLGISAVDGLNGVAQYKNGRLRFELADASSATPELDYPIVSVAVKTRPLLPPGSKTTVAIDLRLSSIYGLTGAYAEESAPGSVTTGGTLYISNVLPGGGIIAAGQRFRVLGGGFTKGLQVRCEGAKLVSVSPNEFQMEAKVPLKLDGLRIVARVDKETVTYFSYLRGLKTAPSGNAALAGLVPVFAGGVSTLSALPLTNDYGFVNAVGIQNPTSGGNNITIAAVSITGQVVATATVRLDPRTNTLRTAEELFGTALPASANTFVAYSRNAFQLTAAQVSGDGVQIRIPNIAVLLPASY